MDMESHGFIHDELELKFLLLYITARLIEPVTFDVILDLALCDEGVNYFAFSKCLDDLVQSEKNHRDDKMQMHSTYCRSRTSLEPRYLE